MKVSPPPDVLGRDWLYAVTHYGYEGYVRASDIRGLYSRDYPYADEVLSCNNIVLARKSADFVRIKSSFADILKKPDLRSDAVASLRRDSVVRLIDRRDDGWSGVRCADGRFGYIRSVFLAERLDNDEFFLRGNLLWQRGIKKISDREEFRRKLTDCALSYLGTQYRWGGKSNAGVDCSGFVFLCYMENGVLIYRDAQMRQGYPVHAVPKAALKPGDLIYWEGHVGMYLGNRRYIHATGNPQFSCVTVNSLDKDDIDYRADLAKNVKAYGSIF